MSRKLSGRFRVALAQSYSVTWFYYSSCWLPLTTIIWGFLVSRIHRSIIFTFCPSFWLRIIIANNSGALPRCCPKYLTYINSLNSCNKSERKMLLLSPLYSTGNWSNLPAQWYVSGRTGTSTPGSTLPGRSRRHARRTEPKWHPRSLLPRTCCGEVCNLKRSVRKGLSQAGPQMLLFLPSSGF